LREQRRRRAPQDDRGEGDQPDGSDHKPGAVIVEKVREDG